MRTGAGAIEITTAPPDSGLADKVIALSRLHQKTLGQLPFAAFHEAARQGALIVAMDGESVIGYALFRVAKRTDSVMFTHLCVDIDSTRRGIAHQLVGAVVERYPTAPGIWLKCRKDYASNDAWPKLGFEARGQSPARAEGRILIHWWRPINDLNLFTFIPEVEQRIAAAIDANVFRDIHEPRREFASSLALHDDWLADDVEFVTTAQLHTEIVDAAEELPKLTQALDQYRHLSPSPDEVAREVERLTPRLMSPDIKEKDRRHIAMASVGGARYFVTRDADIISHAAAIEEMAGVQVLSPSDLVLQLHAEQFESAYRPEAILDTDASVIPLAQVPTRSEFARFADPQNRERARDLESVFRTTAAEASAGGSCWALKTSQNSLDGLVAFAIKDDTMVVRTLRVAPTVHRPTFCRQLIQVLRQEAVDQHCLRIEFADTGPTYVREALLDEGLRPSSGRWEAPCVPGEFNAGSELLMSLESVKNRDAINGATISEAERRFWPARFKTGRVPAYIVPIQPRWARPLFDNDPPQGELFRRPLRLGLMREHVYYRSYRGNLEFPSRVLWYVSGTGPNAGFRGSSWLDAAVSDRPRSLFQRFGAQGIYRRSDVEECVNNPGGKATALIFSRTETFGHTVSLQRGRELHPPLRTNGALQSMSRIDEHVFYDFLNEGQP